MPTKLDLTGERYGRLIAIEPAAKDGRHTTWRCQCDCGNETIARTNSLRENRTASCGCIHKEMLSKRTSTHGMSRTPTYRTWIAMKSRCYNPNVPCYHHYGGRGIAICERWRNSFEAFLEDMGKRPSNSHSIERLDNDGPYSPDNCVWATQTEQTRNSRSNHLITFRGQTKCLTEWAEESGLTLSALLHRLAAGWSIERTLTEPLHHSSQSIQK